MMFEVGALTTMTPAVVAALMSTLSSPTPARATTLSTGAAAMRLGVDLRRRADQHRVRVGERREQRRTVGAVDVADVEVGTEGIDRGGREFFGDEHDRLRHGGFLWAGARAAAGKRRDAAPHAIGARSPHTLSARCRPPLFMTPADPLRVGMA